jgi:hypothetical protein
MLSSHWIKVACRIRPMTDEEILEGATIISHKVANDNVSLFHCADAMIEASVETFR